MVCTERTRSSIFFGGFLIQFLSLLLKSWIRETLIAQHLSKGRDFCFKAWSSLSRDGLQGAMKIYETNIKNLCVFVLKIATMVLHCDWRLIILIHSSIFCNHVFLWLWILSPYHDFPRSPGRRKSSSIDWVALRSKELKVGAIRECGKLETRRNDRKHKHTNNNPFTGNTKTWVLKVQEIFKCQ